MIKSIMIRMVMVIMINIEYNDKNGNDNKYRV